MARTERRLCSVLFCDLVGFTTLSESRDPEEVRELLSGYFDTAREVIARHGGVVEKFIGDAVMAVWGTPIAREGDAERAVRAGLDLVAAVTRLGEAGNLPGLAARVGVVTGQVAVNLDAEGQGMVAGDAVNTASRIQSAAEPGTVFVDDATVRVTRGALAFGHAGTFDLKGKAEPVDLWRAERVVSSVGADERFGGLEAELVGRGEEMERLRTAFRQVVDESSPRLVTVSGPAGVGKSRLGWELEKHVATMPGQAVWCRGRCLPYGDGVAFWGLAEIVRQRLGIADDDSAEVARAAFRTTLASLVLDEAAREFVAPRLERLLGLSGSTATAMDPADLFSGWRVFFEQLARTAPVVLVLEDVQYADEGLLQFVDHLLEWARESPILVLMLGRQAASNTSGWIARPHAEQLPVGRLSDDETRELLGELVQDVPAEAVAAIAARAEGVPLYAVETVRMLIDRGDIRLEHGEYVLDGSIGELAVPETLQSLLAARLDALPPEQRTLVADAAVLGMSFQIETLAALSSEDEADVRAMVAELVERGLLTAPTDAVLPGHGHYGFAQTMLRQVAYDTLSRRDRKNRHMWAADLLASQGGGGPVSDIVADHYLAAIDAMPGDPDVEDLRGEAIGALESAAERAVQTGALAAAVALHLRAADVLEVGGTFATDYAAGHHHAHAGRLLMSLRRYDRAAQEFKASEELYVGCAAGRESAVSRCRYWDALATRRLGADQMPLAIEEVQAAADELRMEPDDDTVYAIQVLSGLHAFAGELATAEELQREAVTLGQSIGITDGQLAQAFSRYARLLRQVARPVESIAYGREAVRLVEKGGAGVEYGPAAVSLAVTLLGWEPTEAAVVAHAAVERLRQLGDRASLPVAYAALVGACYLTGAWLAADAAVTAAGDDGSLDALVLMEALPLTVARGDKPRLRDQVATLSAALADGDADQDRAYLALARAYEAFVDDDDRWADLARQALEHARAVGLSSECLRLVWTGAIDMAETSEDLTEVDRLLDWYDEQARGLLSPVLRAVRLRAGARRAVMYGNVAPEFDEDAVAAAASLGLSYLHAQALVEQAENLRPYEPETARAKAALAGEVGAPFAKVRDRAARVLLG